MNKIPSKGAITFSVYTHHVEFTQLISALCFRCVTIAVEPSVQREA